MDPHESSEENSPIEAWSKDPHAHKFRPMADKTTIPIEQFWRSGITFFHVILPQTQTLTEKLTLASAEPLRRTGIPN